MPQTIDSTIQGQIIGGIFTARENADSAVAAFRELGISETDVQVVVKVAEDRAESIYVNMLTAKGVNADNASYFDEAVQHGKILVVVYNVQNAAPVIDVFDRFQAEYNPNGARNVRQDVLAMTTGAVAGATVGGLAGAALGGPIGLVAGATAGAMVGGGSGAAAGKALEHNK